MAPTTGPSGSTFRFFDMCTVDSWFLHTGARGPAATLKQAMFHEQLATKLIDNTFDSTEHWLRTEPATAAAPASATTPPRDVYGVGTHLAPTIKRRKSTTGGPSLQLAQRDCRV